MTPRLWAVILSSWLVAGAALADERPATSEDATVEAPRTDPTGNGARDDASVQSRPERAQQRERERDSQAASDDHFVPTEQLRYDQEVDYPTDI
jgi:hypothetical protein